jgi:hypothetical protein
MNVLFAVEKKVVWLATMFKIGHFMQPLESGNIGAASLAMPCI